jgi:pyrimidine-nucleoside phosphorylase
MNPVELIRKKRNGGELTPDELRWLITAYTQDQLPDYQMSALLMAVYFRGMTDRETSTFTDLMLHSGQVIDLSTIPGVKVDKHSTGGVGDKVSLILAPMVAACGVPVPMISGRGLGHTGGTLDKLESIPGFRTSLSIDEYKRVIAEVGMVLIGQTEDVAPADRRMYALRDVTGTVESIPLIAGSIMSKKLAEGIDALVLDVKTGDGAFMQNDADAEALAGALVRIGTNAGKTTVAFLTSMDQPLGMTIGNWVEVVESVECLRGKKVPDLMEVTLVLGGAMVMLGGKAKTIEEGMTLCQSAIWSGRAYEKFLEGVRRQGGATDVLENPDRYPAPRFTHDILGTADGVVTKFDTRRMGVLAAELGAGRLRSDDVIDPRAGIVLLKKLGDPVRRGEPIARVMGDREGSFQRVAGELSRCIHCGPPQGPPRPTIGAVVDANGRRAWSTPIIH